MEKACDLWTCRLSPHLDAAYQGTVRVILRRSNTGGLAALGGNEIDEDGYETETTTTCPWMCLTPIGSSTPTRMSATVWDICASSYIWAARIQAVD